jgi:hypothetical protein
MLLNIEKKIYKPRPSTGWVWVGVIGLVLLGIGLLNLFILSGLSGPFLITILLTVPIGIGFLIIAAFFPTMRYEIDDTSLILTDVRDRVEQRDPSHRNRVCEIRAYSCRREGVCGGTPEADGEITCQAFTVWRSSPSA